MPLMEHIRELRNRVLKALLALAVGAVAGWFIEPHDLALPHRRRYCNAAEQYINPINLARLSDGGCTWSSPACSTTSSCA